MQEKIHEELDDIFGDDKERPITMADLGEMKYLERVVKESLRLYPSVPFITRCVTHPFEIGENLGHDFGGVMLWNDLNYLDLSNFLMLDHS